jgi:ferredoxin
MSDVWTSLNAARRRVENIGSDRYRTYEAVGGIAYVRDASGAPMLAGGASNIADSLLDSVLEAAEECPGECIFIDA